MPGMPDKKYRMSAFKPCNQNRPRAQFVLVMMMVRRRSEADARRLI
jgi:hypothetical protein